MQAGGNPFQFIQQQQRAAMPVPKGARGSPKEKDFYNLLNVSADASMKDIKSAFRKLSIEHHPDKSDSKDDTKYREISNAYAVLSSDEKRLCYDAFGKDYEQTPNLELFKQNFKHPEINVTVNATLEQCIKGTNFNVRFPRLVAVGRQEQHQHSFFLAPGTKHQQRIVFPNTGHQEPSKLTGDLVVNVNQIPHKDYERMGNVLIRKFDMKFGDALNGRLSIDHPDQSVFDLVQAKPFQPGNWYRIDGKGATPSEPMFVQLNVILPELKEDQKKKINEVLGYLPVPADCPWPKAEPTRITLEDLQAHLQMAAQSGDLDDRPQMHHGGGPANCKMQ